MKTSMLDRVKLALRIKTSAYDDELNVYIKSCLYDLERLNIYVDHVQPQEEVITAVIVYVKSKFGNSNDSYKSSMKQVYEDLRLTLFLDKSHKVGQ